MGRKNLAMVRQTVTQKMMTEVDPWEKLREEVLNDLTSAWEEQLRSKLLTACVLFTAKSYHTYIYNI